MSEVVQVVCTHEESPDPRRAGECLKCGRTLPPAMIRNRERDRSIIARVTDETALINLAHNWVIRRAGDGPWKNLANRDFKREAIEEAVDGIAYCLGAADQRTLHGYEDPLSSGQLMALMHFTEALKCLLMPDDD